MNIPFKFLDPYKKEDIDFYFGREDDVTTLYELVQKNRIVLVYGPSGTGKTSLIQCGLSNRFGPADWMPFLVRRRENINHSLIDALCASFDKPFPSPTNAQLARIQSGLFTPKNKARAHQSFFADIGITFTPDEIDNVKDKVAGEIPDAVKLGVCRLVYYLLEIAERSLRPVYLVFDQLEELLMYGSQEEKSIFIESLKVITATQKLVSCHVIIIMREEFFAAFDKFGKEIPGITDRRMRIDPLQETDVKRVIARTLTYPPFRITLEDEQTSVEDIFNVLADKKGEVSLPYLQVYLDQLWRTDYARTYPGGYTKPGFPPLEFTVQEVRDCGQIKDVLQKFLTERKGKLGDELKARYPDLQPDFINKVLNEFVSDYGTKLPIVYEIVDDRYYFPPVTHPVFNSTVFPAEPLQYLLTELEKSKLVRNEPGTLELSHDILAKVIDDQRDATERKRIRIRVNIKNYLKEKDSSLSLTEVRDWKDDIEYCDLQEEEKRFFYKWKQIRFKEELEQEDKERAGRRRLRTIAVLLAGIAVISVFLATGYFRAQRLTHKYYALNFFGSKVTTIGDKMDALKLSNYIYNNISNIDDSTSKQVQVLMLKLAADAAIQRAKSVQSLTLLTDNQFYPAANVDISRSGNFFCVEYDSLRTGAARRRFHVYRTGMGKSIADFDSVYYAYFINHSDSLLLAVSSNSISTRLGYPDSFILLDCNNIGDGKGRLITFNRLATYPILNIASELMAGRNSDFDSYDIRKSSAGGLMVPFIDVQGLSTSRKVVFLNNDYTPIAAPFNISFTISNSRDNTLFMFGIQEADNVYMKVTDESGKLLWDVRTGITWGDFTTANSIAYLSGDRLYLLNGSASEARYSIRHSVVVSPVSFKYAYVVDEEKMLLLQYEDDLLLRSFADTLLSKSFFESLAGIQHANNTMVTVPYFKMSGSNVLGNRIFKRSFTHNGDTLVTASFNARVVKTVYNEQRDRVIVETAKEPRSGLAYIHLLDSALHETGSFVITPNDSYMFSADGNTLLLIQDKQLNIFNLQEQQLNFSNFDSLFNWVKRTTKPAELDALKKKYQVGFPSIFQKLNE